MNDIERLVLLDMLPSQLRATARELEAEGSPHGARLMRETAEIIDWQAAEIVRLKREASL